MGRTRSLAWHPGRALQRGDVFSPDDAAHGYAIAVITVGVVLVLVARLLGLHH